MRVAVAVWRGLVVVVALAVTGSVWFELSLLRYFTYLSATAVLVVMVWALVATLRRSSGPPVWLKGWVTVAQLLTAVVAGLALGGGVSLEHVLLPLLVLLDWVLVDEHRWLGARHLPGWLAVVGAYLLVSMVAGLLGAGYPYWFLDPDGVGWGSAGLSIAVVAALATGFGAALIGLDRVLPRRGPLALRTRADTVEPDSDRTGAPDGPAPAQRRRVP